MAEAKNVVLELATLPATASAAEIKDVTDRAGAVVVEGVISYDLIGRIDSELNPHLSKVDPASYHELGGGIFGMRTKRLEGLVQKSDGVVESILDPRYLEWASTCLEWCGEVQLNVAQLIEIGPGEPAQPLHRDEMLWPQLEGGEHELMVSCMLALTDFSADVGATRVVPGSHLRRDLSPDSLDIETETVPAVMKAGDGLFFTGKVIHGGGANHTQDRFRRGLSITCSLGWLKPEEAQTLAVSFERARELPARMRELCSFAGYRVGGRDTPASSHRLELQDPYVVLFGENRQTN